MTTVTISNRHSSPIVRVFEGLRALNASWSELLPLLSRP